MPRALILSQQQLQKPQLYDDEDTETNSNKMDESVTNDIQSIIKEEVESNQCVELIQQNE